MGSGSCNSRVLELKQWLGPTGFSYSEAWGNLPRPGIEPVSSALAGRFLSTVPPGKSCNKFLVTRDLT